MSLLAPMPELGTTKTIQYAFSRPQIVQRKKPRLPSKLPAQLRGNGEAEMRETPGLVLGDLHSVTTVPSKPDIRLHSCELMYMFTCKRKPYPGTIYGAS